MRSTTRTQLDRFPLRTLVLAFALVACGFIASTLYSEIQVSAIDAEAAATESNALPSIEHLNGARTALRHLEVAADQFVDQTVERRDATRAAIERADRDLDRELMAYYALPRFPGEAEVFADTAAPLRDVELGFEHLYELVAAGKEEEARVVADRDVRGAVERADVSLRRTIAVNGAQAHERLVHIGAIRRRSSWIALGLDLVCLLFASVTALVAVRAVRRRAELEKTHAALMSERAEELELFAKRVAHDLLSPLSAMSFSLGLLKRTSEGNTRSAEAVARANACLRRAQRLVDGVLEFARSGATPSQSARADVAEAIDGVVDELRSAEPSDLTIVVEHGRDLEVTCAPGVLTSIVSNLVGNAVKYLGESPRKVVTVRSGGDERLVRVEVADTGPGLPPGLEDRVFEPYVRAGDTSQPGLGLGLATVRRLVEAHAGRVGVVSHVGVGCTFWFELPRAGGNAAPTSVPRPSGEIVRRIGT